MLAQDQKLKALSEQAIKLNIASAIAMWVGNADGPLASAYAGNAKQDTIYDLASLTKILGTTMALAHAHADGVIDLNERPWPWWPEQRVRDLMAHRSGLLAHKHFYREPGVKIGRWAENRRIMLKALYAERPHGAANEERLYSDLNFLALGELLAARRKKNLIEIFADAWRLGSLKNPCHSYASSFSRSENPAASTGWCAVRYAQISAQVHDLNCYFLGGIAGHAGLFGTLNDAALVGQFFLSCFRAPSSAFASSLKYFMHQRLGFDHPTKNGSVKCLSPQSFGHFGFTGVSLWIDPLADHKGRAYVLLTNRVATSTKPEGIFWLREKFHRLASS